MKICLISRIFFSSKQSFGKAVKKVKRVLPKDLNKKKIVIQTLAQSVGILPKDSHQRVSRKLSTNIKDTIVLFYCLDNEIQLLSKTIIVEQHIKNGFFFCTNL